MTNEVKALTDKARQAEQMADLARELRAHRKQLQENNKQVERVNDRIDVIKEEEQKEKKLSLKKLETQTQWVKSSESALKVNPEDIIRKLNIL